MFVVIDLMKDNTNRESADKEKQKQLAKEKLSKVSQDKIVRKQVISIDGSIISI